MREPHSLIQMNRRQQRVVGLQIQSLRAHRARRVKARLQNHPPHAQPLRARRHAHLRDLELPRTQRNQRTHADRLTITPVSQNSIHFDLHLEFYNGHECGLEGGALYRKDGSFVFEANPATAVKGWPACHLAITPTPTGITLQDLLGPDLNNGCKMMSCGERGGYNGAGFKFTDRVTPAQTKKPPTK